jgi:hypothetical protein
MIEARPSPVLPDYAGPCISNVGHGLLDRHERLPGWLPGELAAARSAVLVVLDGLGWEQLDARRHLAPALTSMVGRPITSVAPSTTATALTSISTGLGPGEHGLVGYRMDVDGEVLNTLRWAVDGRDRRRQLPPDMLQPHAVFNGRQPPVVTKSEFEQSGFTAAHLGGVRFAGYRLPSSLVVETGHLVQAGEPFVYAYYDGIDKVSHEYGLDAHYDAELAAADGLIGQLLESLPHETALVVVSDHGQVHVGDRVRVLPDPILRHVDHQSGEGRFRWLHAKGGRAQPLLDAACDAYAHEAWVVSQEQVVDEGWFGPRVGSEARRRLGDVALVPFEPVAYFDPDDSGPFQLIGRHGSLTSAEMYVPLLVAML